MQSGAFPTWGASRNAPYCRACLRLCPLKTRLCCVVLHGGIGVCCNNSRITCRHVLQQRSLLSCTTSDIKNAACRGACVARGVRPANLELVREASCASRGFHRLLAMSSVGRASAQSPQAYSNKVLEGGGGCSWWDLIPSLQFLLHVSLYYQVTGLRIDFWRQRALT